MPTDAGPSSRHSPAGRVALYVVLTLCAILFLLPLYWLLASAFKSQDRIYALPPEFLPLPPVWGNFHDVFEQTRMARAFFNSTVIAVAHVALTLFLCSLAGFAFAAYKRAPGNKGLFLAVLATMMIPGAVTLVPVFVLLAELRLVDTYWGMILPGAAGAFGIFWMRQYISANVPTDLYAAARIDGCSEFGIYWRIVLPVAKPALAALGVLTLIANWNNLMWAFIVLRSEHMQTMPLLIYLLQGELRTPWGMLMAAGVLATAPLIVAFLIFQRAFIGGMTAGAVKS